MHELLTVEDVATLLKVSRKFGSNEHTEVHAVRREPSACRTFRSASTNVQTRGPFASFSCGARRSREPFARRDYNGSLAPRHEEPTGRKDSLVWLARDGNYGSDVDRERRRMGRFDGGNWKLVRWPHQSGCASKRWENFPCAEAVETLRRRSSRRATERHRLDRESASNARRSDGLATSLETSTSVRQKNHRHIMEKHLVPRFGDLELSE